MIVLDEHLPAAVLSDAIGRWYRGRICVVTDLRSGSVIKDDAIANLLQTVDQPTFVTLNWADFWRRIAAHRGFCLVGFTLPSKRAEEIPSLLRRLFRLSDFRTKTARMGKIARIGVEQVAYYQVHDPQVHQQPLP
jgi:hypothetical protein